MPAPSLEHLFDMQANIEAGFVAYLSANGITAYGTRYTGDIADKRVLLMYRPGASAGYCAIPTTTNTGEMENDWFNGEITFIIQTERALAEASEITGFASLHDYRVAQIKVLMLRGALNGTISGKTALALDYHRIAVLSEGAEENSVEDDAFDVTSLSYAVQIQIKSDAWPA